jgi:hypothetical protein
MSRYKKIALVISIIFMAMMLFPNKSTAAHKDSTALKRFIISAGVGDPAMIYIDNFINNGYKFKSDQRVVPQVNPLYAKIEYLIFHHIGIGVDMSYDDYEAQQIPPSSTIFTNSYKGYTFVTNIRLNKHFHLIAKRLDLYIGAGLGYEVQSITNIITTQSLPKFNANNLAFEITIGGRFYITKRVGLYIEGGIARSILQGGIAVRL